MKRYSYWLRKKERGVFIKKQLTFVILCIIFNFTACADYADRPYNLSVYYGEMTGDSLHEVFFEKPYYDPSYKMIVAAFGMQLNTALKAAVIEGELQAAWHFDAQEYNEFNTALIARWIDFPWNRVIFTTFAFGAGVSYASEKSEIEMMNHHGKTANFLGYLVYEAELAPSEDSSWSIFARIHHRSGLYGTFSGVRGASNAWGAGIRRRFD